MPESDLLEEFRLLMLADASLFQTAQHLRTLDLTDLTARIDALRAEIVERVATIQGSVYELLADQSEPHVVQLPVPGYERRRNFLRDPRG